MMPPIHRFATGRVRVPTDLPDAARWALSLYIEEPEIVADCWMDYQWRALRRMRPFRRYASGFIITDAHEIATVRNLLDLEALNGDAQCDYYAQQDGFTLSGDNDMCLLCEWCKAIVLRDRFDYWLDQAGFPKNAYIYDIEPEIEDLWRHVYEVGGPLPPDHPLRAGL